MRRISTDINDRRNIVAQFILVFNWVEYEPAKSGDYVYPAWANVVGWIVALLPVFVILVMMAIKYFTCDIKGTCFEVSGTVAIRRN